MLEVYEEVGIFSESFRLRPTVASYFTVAPTVLFLLFLLSSRTKWYDMKALEKPSKIELVSLSKEMVVHLAPVRLIQDLELVSHERQSHKIQCRRQEKLIPSLIVTVSHCFF